MIRTEVTHADGTPHWLIVNQIEHARISGEVARRLCQSSESGFAHDPLIADEVLHSVDHHDDGWAEWDRCPRLDASTGVPTSFREMTEADALAIWSGSIESAAKIGPLAGWLVASHFRGLKQSSSKDSDLQALEHWLAEVDAKRQHWITDWQRQNRATHTLEVAQRWLLFLQVVDVMSLWLCSACFREDHSAEEPYPIAASTEMETSMGLAGIGEDGTTYEVLVDPWRFTVPEFELTAQGMMAPVGQYRDGNELVAAYKKRPLHWRLRGKLA